MLYHLLFPLHETYTIFNVMRYSTFRTVMAGLVAFLIAFVCGPWLIRRLRALEAGQPIRADGPERHLEKAGTPTMGGTLILFSFFLATLLLADLTNAYVWVTLGVTLAFGIIGFVDDWTKLRRKQNQGLTGRQKLLAQFGVAVVTSGVVLWLADYDSTLTTPFFKNVRPDLGLFYVPFASLVIVASSNAVNLTDGLDGLAIGPVMTTIFVYLVFCFVAGNVKLADYLQVPYVEGASELSIFCGALLAACLGFLWFNAYPAQMFMGDVGSLALGAAVGTLALVSRQELVLVVAGGVFVAEALSVILQVGSFRFRQRRIFRMAPIHHHFELLGWTEPKIIVRFWILSILCALLALSTLKLR